jgi:hypothetical protein
MKRLQYGENYYKVYKKDTSNNNLNLLYDFISIEFNSFVINRQELI